MGEAWTVLGQCNRVRWTSSRPLLELVRMQELLTTVNILEVVREWI